MSTINFANSQIYLTIPREDSIVSLLNSFVDLNIEVIKTADNSRYANDNYIKLNILGPFPLFNNSKMTISSVNYLEDITQAHIVPLMYKLITSAKVSDDLSIGFERD